MLNLYKLFFFTLMITGSLIAISSFNWFIMWIGLEMNLLSIIPLLKSNKNIFPTEAALKYFITQVMASMVVLFSIILLMNYTEFIPMNYNYWILMMMNSAFLMKLGAAPLHSWFPEVAEGLNWKNNMILLTWQKLSPMILIMYNLNMPLFFSFIIIISSIISGIMGLNQISLRKIMAYSSINHIAWMLASMLHMKMIFLIYFLIYTMISLNIMLMFDFFKIFFLTQIFMIFIKNKINKLILMMNLFSLGGLPPFLGFLPKWLTLNNLISNNFYSLSVILIVFTLVTLFFYMRMILPSLTLTLSEITYFSPNFNSNNLMIFNFINLFGIFICTSIFYIF